tara:strand:+ start:240 stop:455 length:216 start_codon:yes stop_codon:yes gene_type:complete
MMNNSIKDQAFPDENNYGISIRDYFAAKAMQSYISDKELVDMYCYLEKNVKQEVAVTAYMMADAMLKAREE